MPLLNSLYGKATTSMFDFLSSWLVPTFVPTFAPANKLTLAPGASGGRQKAAAASLSSYKSIEKETLEAMALASSQDVSSSLRQVPANLANTNNSSCMIECTYKSLEAASIVLRVAQTLDSRLQDSESISQFFRYLQKVEQAGLCNDTFDYVGKFV